MSCPKNVAFQRSSVLPRRVRTLWVGKDKVYCGKTIGLKLYGNLFQNMFGRALTACTISLRVVESQGCYTVLHGALHVAPFIHSCNKNIQILVTVDGFRKFCVLEPVRDTSVKGVLKSLSQLIAIFGVPFRIVTDRGSAFTSHMFETFCIKHGIKHVLNAVATCERMNLKFWVRS